MSYARFGWEGSDVYVFRSSAALECCGCILQERKWEDNPKSFIGGFMVEVGEHVETYFTTTAGMLGHLELHKAAGHIVPDSCIAELIADAVENDAALAKPETEA